MSPVNCSINMVAALMMVAAMLTAIINITAAPTCKPYGHLHGTSHSCNRGGASDCCQAGKLYPQYKCSPPLIHSTPAILTLNCFEKGGCGGAPSECDGDYHSDSELVVALSTGWYAHGSRCLQEATITNPANGRVAVATVVDECDSQHGCDAEHNYEPPCLDNIVDASPAVWKALGVSPNDPDYGYMKVTWTMA